MLLRFKTYMQEYSPNRRTFYRNHHRPCVFGYATRGCPPAPAASGHPPWVPARGTPTIYGAHPCDRA